MAVGNIIAGTTLGGVPVKVLVDKDGRIDLGEDSPLEAVQVALLQSLLRETIALRLGMIKAGTCKEVKQSDVEAIRKKF